MQIHIRKEDPTDYKQIAEIIREAFRGIPYSDQSEHILVSRLRASTAYLPELALVAIIDGAIVGHILFTRLHINNAKGSFRGLALAPVSVLPDFQKKGYR